MTTKTPSFTPGPWRIEDWPLDIVAGEYSVVARCEDRLRITPPEAEANARLIASCPNLLEALRPFAALGVETCGKCGGDGMHGATEMACTLCGGIGRVVVGFPDPHDVDAAKAAISKALNS